MKSPLKLGTRRSLLAWAQSSWVAREVERLNPDVRVELEGIDTRGDRILDVSLQSVEGKEFFVAELDDALRSGRVDFTVHSMKDLSLDRPADFVQAAYPKRANPRDVVLFGPGVMDKIAAGKTLRIGTSSPRRLENIPTFLTKALPTVNGQKASIQLVDIRGNVNTRLGRVHEPERSERHLDATVLAFAGLIRLAADSTGGPELRKLLQGVRWMVLPLRESPAAAAQGCLAIECRAADAEVRAALSKLHDSHSEEHVRQERALLAEWGGGCHQKFGATSIEHPELGALFYIRGVKPDGAFVEELRWNKPAAPTGDARSWDGSAWRSKAALSEPAKGALPARTAAVFVANARAWPQDLHAKDARVWTSGVSSWFQLADQGIWVEGCAEELGFEMLAPTLAEPVLALPPLKDWAIVTHEDARASWPEGHVVATYRLDRAEWPAEAKAALAQATHIYWSSGSQFDELRGLAPAGAVHACGPGKTASHLKNAGIHPLVFPSIEEWRAWLKK